MCLRLTADGGAPPPSGRLPGAGGGGTGQAWQVGGGGPPLLRLLECLFVDACCRCYHFTSDLSGIGWPSI